MSLGPLRESVPEPLDSPVAAEGAWTSSSLAERQAHRAALGLADLPPVGPRGPCRTPTARSLPSAPMHEYQPLFDELCAAIDRRRRAEAELIEQFPPGDDERQRDLGRQLAELAERREAELAGREAEFAQRRRDLAERSNANLQAVEFAHREALREIERRHHEELRELEEKYQSSTWVTTSILDDDSEESPKRKFEKYKSLLLKSREDQVAAWTDLQQSFDALVEQYGWRGGPPTEPTDPPADRDAAQERFQAAVHEARRFQTALEKQVLGRLFIGLRPLWLFGGLAAAIFLPLFLFLPPSLVRLPFQPLTLPWAAATGGAACLAALLIELVVYTLAAMSRSEAIRQMQQAVAEAGWAHQKWLALARDELQDKTREFEARQRDVVRQREEALRRFQAAHQERRDDIESRRAEAHRAEERRYLDQRRQLEQQRAAEEQALAAEERRRLSEAAQRFEQQHSRLQRELDDYTHQRQREQAQRWNALKTDWETTLTRFRGAVEALTTASEQAFPDWETLAAGGWRPADAIPPSVRFGRYLVDLAQLDGALSTDERLVPPETVFTLPALLPFPHASSLLLKFRGHQGRAAAIAVQQTILLRLLTLLPPGTLRLTILDPVGLGESFAGLMHLADYDEQLVHSRIWTETSQIEARLADLTEHMENVFQKYLRNEFATIEEYNLHAGEVAEPYQFLVISDFPAKFSDVAARRLTSILTSGPRCGVYTLLSADLAQPLPNNCRLADVQAQMRTLAWRDGAFYSVGGESLRPRGTPAGGQEGGPNGEPAPSDASRSFASAAVPLLIDPPPPPEVFTAIVKMVGRESKDARRVEVPFSRVAPRAEQWWTHDSRREIDVPLGRAGATRLQHVRLGVGTSQHMLVAGKTGSGKSTFLHALITNVALHYSPEEVRFYLIDFKKGVEFKDYAACRLPHADVIAIESDREFGVSALQRLDAVLQERGELFRRHGVQDIAGYRHAQPDRPLPRILLVVDEFQEFFIEDDKLSQTASLLLDRLVRQGRAFGMHVILGSQTLGGAYSLARSTLGQVAVRVALQCSEADAHLILSESNTAARLLSRPGEAIYNDANGLVEGNHPFQVAWLPDDERERLLLRLAELARQRHLEAPPPIVFEGNVPSDPARNPELVTLLTAAYASTRAPSPASRAGGEATPLVTQRSTLNAQLPPLAPPTIWLGESVDIGPPTALTFHRHAGSHLLLIGGDGEAAFGVMATALLALTAQLPAGEVPEESPPPVPTEPDVEPQAVESAVMSAALPASPIWLLDGSPPGSVEAEWWERLCAAAPRPPRRFAPRQAAQALAELAAELQQRRADPETMHPTRFVLVYDVSRFRDLRKAEDDYGFGSFGSRPADKPIEPGKLLADLIAQGPEVGLHVLLWCDSAGNVERWFSRQTLKELEHRVAFQMNAADSSQLIDSPAASRLGVHRALLYREEQGTCEKFRPYGPPSPTWLERLRQPPAPEDVAVADRPPAAAPSSSPAPTAADNLEIATDLDAFIIT